MFFKKKITKKSGFTLVELLVGVTVFTILIIAVYNSYKTIFDVVSVSRYKISAVDLSNEKLEIIRNLPYSQVGVSGSIPNGVLSHLETVIRDGQTFDITTTVRNIDDPFDGTLGGTPNDTSPADSKLIEIKIDCDNCKSFRPIVVTSRVSPKNLETATTNGALLIRVFDANGNPISNANVHIENNQISPAIVIDDVTNNSGNLLIVDAPPGNFAYEVTVTKSGFSTDSTASTTVANPNPTKPQLTVLLQQVTTQSFVIDRVSTINFSSITSSCNPVASIPFNLTGSKTIGTSPTIYKYSEVKTTNGSGVLTLSNMEWDTYNLALTSGTHELIGTNSLSPIQIAPNSTTDVNLIVAPKNPNSILVVVKDGTTLLPLSDVTVELISGVSTISTKYTGKGFQGQSDWSGGAGQSTSTDLTMYLQSDGNIENNSPVGDIKLQSVFGVYETDGNLESSSFDTGNSSNFKEIVWNPTNQHASTGPLAVRFKVATNSDGGVWDFKGPDGTTSTYYDLVNRNIHSGHNGDRYFRYKVFLHTDDTDYTPNISDISFTFTNSCTPPGQVFFSGLSNQSYTIRLSKTGYESQDVVFTANTAWQSIEVILLPE